jgi:hypothetical protein
MATKTELKKKATGKKRSFHQELVLNRWVLGFFQGGTLAALKMRLGDDRHEGIDEDGQTKFFHELTRGLFDPNKVPEADLRRYDLNVVAHWQAITAQRNKLEGHELQMKYFPVAAVHRDIPRLVFQQAAGAAGWPERRAGALPHRAWR